MDFRPIGFDCEYVLGYFCLQPGAGERQDTPPSPDYFLTCVNFNAENPMEDEGNKVSPDYFLTHVNINAENPMEDEGNKVSLDYFLTRVNFNAENPMEDEGDKVSPDYFLTRVNFNAENPMEDEGNKVGESVPLKKIIELKWNGNFLMRGDGFFRVGIDRAHFADFILDVQNCYSHSHLHI
jgi:hypothetical protein